MVEHATGGQQRGAALADVSASLPLRLGADLAASSAMLPTGLAALDACIGGLALHRIHLLAGTSGSGAMLLLHHLFAAVTPAAPVLLLDYHCRFHPPAAAAAGVHLPHLLWVRERDWRQMMRALTFALREPACPLVVLTTLSAPAPTFLERLRPLVRQSQCALLIATAAGPLPTDGVDGVTLAVAHRVWVHGAPGRPGCTGRTITVTVTDRARVAPTRIPLTFTFPQPLPPFVRIARKGGDNHAEAACRGHLGAGAPAPVCRAG